MSAKHTSLQFDHGTLLVDVEEEQAKGLPGVLWDPRVLRFRAPAFRYRELAVELKEPVEPREQLPEPIRAPDLRPYQRAAVTAWEVTGRRGVAVMPTGSGKTRVALGAIARLGRPTLVLVPTRVLLGQWEAAIAGFSDGEVGAVGDGRSNVTPLTVCTFESAYRQMDRLGALFSLLVVDEVHHLGHRLRAEALEMCAAPARLGLTATPPLDHAARQRMEQLVGPVVSCHTVAELSGRHLAPYARVPIQVRLSREERQRYEEGYAAYLGAYGSICRLGHGRSAARLCSATVEGKRGLAGLQRARRALATAEAKHEVVAALLARHRKERVLLFTADTVSAYATSRRLLVPAITFDIRRRERAAILQRLQEGRYRAVVSAQVLNEGLDLPDCRVGVVLGASQGGDRESAQRLGRLLRPAPGKTAVLYELLAERTFEVEHAQHRSQAE